MELVTYVEEKDVEGANFKTMSTRVYNYPGIASHLLGRVGKITAENADYYSELGYPMDAYVGTSGCELAFESILHGQDGIMVIKYDRDGNIVEKYYEKEPISGNDVWLTIDIDLQIAAENGLAEAAKTSSTGKAGAVTAMDPRTGAVLAIASYPTYDLSKFSSTEYYDSLLKDKNNPLVNRALMGVYAPGSTYKIGSALAALEKGAITSSYTLPDELACDGSYNRLHHPTCLGSHGNADVYEAIQESCNVFFYEIGYQMGINPITDYTKKLGLGSSTGIELAESKGTVAGPAYSSEWNEGNDVSAAIGQSDHGYTPLQLSVYMSSVINGGTRYHAHLLGSVRNFYTKEVITAYETGVAETVSFSQSTRNTLITAMGMVVSENSEISRYFKNVPVEVGGKTGTAEVAGQKDNALFSGFAPLNKPEIVVSCIVEEGQHGYFASIAAARVMEEYFKEK
jgi:penicillin-binding protein 2